MKICFQEKCIIDWTEIANTFTYLFINIGQNLTKNSVQKDQIHISFLQKNT